MSPSPRRLALGPTLAVLFVVVPLVELYVILQVGAVIGAGWTIAILVADSLLGAWLLKREGRRAWRRFRDALQAARWPGDEVTQGALVLVGGTLLLTPGFVTDVVGFLLLFAPTRVVASRAVRAWVSPVPLRGRARDRDRHREPQDDRSRRQAPPGQQGDILDVEVVEIHRDDPPETSA